MTFGPEHSLVEQSLALWDVPEDAQATLINVSENMTYLIEAPGFKSVLRLHRAGYHSRRAIESELTWLESLGAETDVLTPDVIPGRDGTAVQTGAYGPLQGPRFMVMFAHHDGTAPTVDGDLTREFGSLGQIAAACHTHTQNWVLPNDFSRMSWDIDDIFGVKAVWGHWRDAPGVTKAIEAVLARVEPTIRARLSAYGKAPHRYNLIHGDMRLANLLVHQGDIRLIDFDDCGFGWLLYDFAAAISFMEDDPRVPEWKAAWLDGYRGKRALTAADETEIDTFVMLRRMALLAWIGSHMEAPEPQALAGDFAERTAGLAEAWLAKLHR
ncbi:MAG: phosphotransferase [Pseudomonadota bacterium]